MSSVKKAYETQINNIQKKSGRSLAELETMIRNSGLVKHSELREMLMRELGLGYGDANSLVHFVLKSDGERAAKVQGLSSDEVLQEIYQGPKTSLLPIHQRIMEVLGEFGDFDIAPKKGYVSLRRKKQFAMIGPATNTRVEVGINSKSLLANPRLIAQPAGSMCNFVVKLTHPEEVDEELIAWIRRAFEEAG